MKALVLAGGKGTRLRPLTYTRAKQLVPVANKPILFHGLEHLAQAGIKEVGMIVGDTADEVMDAVGDGARWDVEITYIPQEAPLGLAHTVLTARDFLADEDFVMYLGDNLLRQGVAGFVASFEARRSSATTPTLEGPALPPPIAQILLARVPDPQRFGVAQLDANGEVIRLVEKPEVPPSDLALVGVYLFDQHIHEAVRAITPSARGELEITDAIQWLIDQGHRVVHEVVEGWWIDTGKLEPLLEGNRLILETIEPRIAGTTSGSRIEGKVIVEAGAHVEDSVVRGPVVIGPRTTIRDAYIGPFTAIGADCEIVDSEVEHSIILDRASIRNVPRLTDSLIGYDAEVRRTKAKPRAARLMVGDHSQVDIG